MAILGEIRKRSWLLVGVIALALLAFLVNPDTIDKVFGKNPNILGKVNGEEITRDELNDQLFIMQQQAQQQGQPTKGLEEQAWGTQAQHLVECLKQQMCLGKRLARGAQALPNEGHRIHAENLHSLVGEEEHLTGHGAEHGGIGVVEVPLEVVEGGPDPAAIGQLDEGT